MVTLHGGCFCRRGRSPTSAMPRALPLIIKGVSLACRLAVDVCVNSGPCGPQAARTAMGVDPRFMRTSCTSDSIPSSLLGLQSVRSAGRTDERVGSVSVPSPPIDTQGSIPNLSLDGGLGLGADDAFALRGCPRYVERWLREASLALSEPSPFALVWCADAQKIRYECLRKDSHDSRTGHRRGDSVKGL